VTPAVEAMMKKCAEALQEKKASAIVFAAAERACTEWECALRYFVGEAAIRLVAPWDSDMSTSLQAQAASIATT
jgi:hypothetical protein